MLDFFQILTALANLLGGLSCESLEVLRQMALTGEADL